VTTKRGLRLGPATSAVSLLLAGCFASPDYTKITCQGDTQCPSDYRCNLTIRKCSLAMDASFPGEAGGSHADGAIELDIGKDLNTAVDGGPTDRVGFDTAATAGGDAAVDSPIVIDLVIPDALIGSDVASQDAPPGSPDGPIDLPPDAQMRIDLASSDLGGGGTGGSGSISFGDNGGNGSGGIGSGGVSSGGSGSGGLQGTGGSGSGGLQGTGGSLPCGGTCPDPTTGLATGHGVCAGTTCQVQCNAGYHLCGPSACYGNSDSQHCGSSCQSCVAPTGGTATCTSDICGMNCGTQTLCGTACTNTDADAQNCGRCSHICGGTAACLNGRCQPASMISALPSTAGYDVGPDGLFYTSNGTVYGCTQTSCSGTNQRQIGGGFASTSDLVLTRGMTPNQVVFYASPSQPNNWLYACPVTTGCPSSPSQIVGYGAQSQASLRSFQANNGDVYYQNVGMVSAIYHCLGASSSCTLTAGGGPGTAHVPSADSSLDVARAFATDATYVYFFESINSFNDFALDRCPNNASCATPDVLVASIFTPTILVAYNGKLYWSQSKSGDPITQCDLPACTTQTNFLAAMIGDPLGMAVDASGVYWMTTSGIYTCPLTGCPAAGPTVVTSSISGGSKELRVQDSSVYWLVPGSGTDGAIYRIAKP
jgi:hypothetical protein